MSFHRNAIFLLGLFPVVILLWAWADSLHFITGFSKNSGNKGQTSAAIAKAALRVSTTRIPPDADTSQHDPGSLYKPNGPFGDFIRNRTLPNLTAAGVPAGDPWFPPYRHTRSNTTAFGIKLATTSTIIPFWLILACYLPLWLAASRWRARALRKRLPAALPA